MKSRTLGQTHEQVISAFDAVMDTIERVLGKVGGNRSRAAQLLGISRRNLLRKLELLGLGGADDGVE